MLCSTIREIIVRSAEKYGTRDAIRYKKSRNEIEAKSYQQLKEDSEKFTFLMLFPLVIGSVVLNLDDFVFNRGESVLLVISFILTFMVTLFSIKILNKIIKNDKLYYFSYYCLIVGNLLFFIS